MEIQLNDYHKKVNAQMQKSMAYWRGHHATPQRTWWDEKELTDRFSCEVASLVCVYEMLKSSFDHSF